MNKLETIVAWLLTGTLLLIAIGTALGFMVSYNFFSLGALIYYLATSVIICPKTPINLSLRTFCGLMAFIIGLLFGLV